MANLVTQSLKILSKATMNVGKEYTSNLTTFINDAKDVKNTILNTGTDAADTYAKLKRTNITKAIHDWFYQEEAESEMSLNTGSDEFDAGFSATGEAKEDEDSSKPKVLSADAMTNIANKQTNAIIKVGRRQTEQSVANTAEIVSSLNSRSAEMLTAVNNINKTLLGISSRLDKIIELQAVPLTNQQQEIDKGGLYQDGKLSLMRIFEQSKNSLVSSGPLSYLTAGLDMLKSGQLGPSALASLGIKAAAQKIQVNGKSFDDWGNAFNEMIGTATQTAMNEMINSNVFKKMFPSLTSFEKDKDYGTVVPNMYDNKRAVFDGMTKMSIINVIPQMLAKINQSISGQEYHLDSRGKWIAGPMKNEFNEVTRASFQSGGLSNKMATRISNAGVQSIGKKIPSEDIRDASEALTMAMVMKLHREGDRSFSASRIKTELVGEIDNAVSVLSMLGRGDADYWYKVCQTIVVQLSSGMLDSASFVTNINQSLQKMISDATNFAQSGKANASQAGKLTFNMAANQFLAAHNAPVPANLNPATNNNGTLTSADGSILNPGHTLGKYSTGQYVSGIYYLLNRGINVRIDKSGERYDPVSLAQVRPDATPYVSDDTFGKMVAEGLTGGGRHLDDIAEDAVNRQLLGDGKDNKGFLGKLLDNPAMLLNSATNLMRGGASGFGQSLKDKARNFLGEERYDAIANKLGGIKDNINDRLSHDQRFLDARDKAKEKWGEFREGAADKLDQFGHSRLVNNAFYNADSLRLKAGQNLINNYTSDDANDMASLSFAKHYIEEGRFDDAMDVVNGINDDSLKQTFANMINIHKKRADGSAAAANGEQAEIGAVLISRGEDDDGKVEKDESQRSILGRMLGMVGRIAKGVAKLAVRGGIDLTMGLKSMAQGLLLGYKDTDPTTGETHYNKGLIRNLTTVPLGAMAKGIKNGVGAVATGVKNALTNDEGESIVSKGFNTVRGLLNKLLDGIGAFKDMVRDKIGSALDKLKESRVGQAFSKAGQFLQKSKFVRGFTSGFKDAKEARDKLLNSKKREEAVSEDPLAAEQTEMMEGKRPSIFTKIHDLLMGISGSVSHQESLAEDQAERDEENSNSGGGGSTGGNIGDVLEDTSGQPRNSDGSEDPKGLLGSIGSVLGDVMGSFGKMMGGMTQALLGIGEMVISIVTSLESFGALKDMVQSILVDGLQPLNEAFDAIMEAIKPLVDTLKGMVETIARVVVRIAKSLIDVVQPIIEAVMPIIQTVIDLLSPILEIIEVLMNVIMIPIKIAMDIISPVIEGIGYTLQVVSGVLQIGLGAVMGLLGGVVSGLGLILSAIGKIPIIPGGDNIKKSGDSLKATGKDMLEMSKTMMTAGAEQIKQGIQGGISLIQRLIPGGEDGKKEEPEENTTVEDKRKATLANEFAAGNASPTTINNSWSYTYGSGNTNTTMNQHSYGSYMNMSERGCGPVALADAYGRRSGANVNPATLAAAMTGAGTYDPRRGTSVSSMLATGNAMGMGMRLGGVTAASISRATPDNPITVLGSGQGFGTKAGNNHYVNVVGTDRFGGAYVSNPMTGRVDRQAASNIVRNSKLGLYGSGDNDDLSEYGFSDDAMESLQRLKDLTGKLTSMFTGESEAEKKINDANAEQKAKEIKRTLGDAYDAVEQQVIAELKNRYPELDDAGIKKKLNSRVGWDLIYEYGGQAAADVYTEGLQLVKRGADEAKSNLESITSSFDAINIADNDAEGEGLSGAEMTQFAPILHPVADFPQDGSGRYNQSPIHDFFNATEIAGKANWRVGGGKGDVYSSSRGGWYKLYKDPHTTEGEGTSGDAHEGVLLRYTGDGTALAKAITGGTVTYVTKGEEGETTGLGNAVKWRDSGGMYHWYMHMNSLDKEIQEGSNLEPGQLIGYFGNTGGMDPDGKYLRYVVTSAGPQGNTGDPGHVNPFTFWEFKQKSDDLEGDTELQQIFNYLVNHFGMSESAAAGIMGVWSHEGMIEPEPYSHQMEGIFGNDKAERSRKIGKNYDTMDAYTLNSLFPDYDSRGYNINKPGYFSGVVNKYLPGIGLAQWTGDRNRQLVEFAKEKGMNWWDLQAQLDFVEAEKQGAFNTLMTIMTDKSISPTDAADYWMTQYEAGYPGHDPYAARLSTSQVEGRRTSAKQLYEQLKGTSSGGTITPENLKDAAKVAEDGTYQGKFIGRLTNPDAFLGNTDDIMKSAAQVFSAYYDQDGHYEENLDWGTLTLNNGTQLAHFRPDCSGMMSAVIKNMGYTLEGVGETGFSTGDWLGKASNNTIYKNGAASTDWQFLPYSGVLKPGDIMISKAHTGMYITGENNTSWGNRGFDGGATDGIENSALAGKALLNGESDWKSKLAWTISGADTGGDQIKTILRYMGKTIDQSSNEGERGGLTFKTGIVSSNESAPGGSILKLQEAIAKGESRASLIQRYDEAIVDKYLAMAYKNNEVPAKPVEKDLSAGTLGTTPTTTGTGTNTNNYTKTTYTTVDPAALERSQNKNNTLSNDTKNLLGSSKTITTDVVTGSTWDPNEKTTYSKTGSVGNFVKNVWDKGLLGWDKVTYDDGSEPSFWAKAFPAAYANGDVSSTSSGNTWENWLFNSDSDIPPVDASKLADDSGMQQLQQFTNKYNIQSTDARRTEFFERIGNMTFNVRAKRVEELLEIMINKMDGNGTTEPLPNLFDDDIPEAVTRLSMG